MLSLMAIKTNPKKVIFSIPVILLISFLALSAGPKPTKPPKTITWKLDNLEKVGGYKPVILGSPSIIREKSGAAIFFDGVKDGLIFPVNPIENRKAFTIEVLVKPDRDGPIAPRFLHIQDSAGKRLTMEMRLDQKGYWYTDTFLKNGAAGQGLTLIDSTKLHPVEQWYWIALVYDNKNMRHFINAVKELEGTIEFGPMDKGDISIGVRLNRVSWFKGQIREIRFHDSALEAKELQHR
jgi:hypothetical protein